MLKPFPKDGIRIALIDRLKVTLWCEGRYRYQGHPICDVSAVKTTNDLGLAADVPITLSTAGSKYGTALRWKQDTGAVIQRLGGFRQKGTRPTNKISQSITINPLREIRKELTDAEVKRHNVPMNRKSNFVHPRAVPSAELQQRVVAKVVELVSQARVDYLKTLRALFGKKLPKIPSALIRASIDEVEITWDVACKSTGFLLHAFEEPWMRRMDTARVQYVLDGTISKEAEDRGLAFRSSHGYLAATLGKGFHFKLYPLPGSAVRFEGTLNKKKLNKLELGRWNLFDDDSVKKSLRRCARKLYPHIQEVQGSLKGKPTVSMVDALTLLAPPKRGEALRTILEELLGSGKVTVSGDKATVNRDESKRQILVRLSKSGFVEKAERGCWRLTEAYAQLFDALRRHGLDRSR